MSQRVSIVAPGEEAVASRRSSTNKEPAPAPAAPESSEKPPAIATDNTEAKELSPFDPFPDACQRYKEDCCCCHCKAVRRALERIAYLRTPEGKRRLEMKMHLRSIFTDIEALTLTREHVNNILYGTEELHPSPHKSFPVSIVKVAPIDSKCIYIDWFVHSTDKVAHYEIYLNNRLRKRIFDPKQTTTVLLDLNTKITHNFRMKAVPTKGLGWDANPIDKLVKDACCGGLKKAIKGDYFCQCSKLTESEKVEKGYKRQMCQNLVDFWKDSEFIYLPSCTCKKDCDCACTR